MSGDVPQQTPGVPPVELRLFQAASQIYDLQAKLLHTYVTIQLPPGSWETYEEWEAQQQLLDSAIDDDTRIRAENDHEIKIISDELNHATVDDIVAQTRQPHTEEEIRQRLSARLREQFGEAGDQTPQVVHDIDNVKMIIGKALGGCLTEVDLIQEFECDDIRQEDGICFVKTGPDGHQYIVRLKPTETSVNGRVNVLPPINQDATNLDFLNMSDEVRIAMARWYPLNGVPEIKPAEFVDSVVEGLTTLQITAQDEVKYTLAGYGVQDWIEFGY